MKAFNKTSFTKISATVKTSGQTVANGLQELIEMGLHFYNEHGDATYLTKSVEVAISARSVKADDVKTYITAHANVRWVVEDGKESVFKKKGKGKQISVTEPTQTWYEYTKQDAVKPELDPEQIKKALMAQIKKIAKAFDDEHVKAGTESECLELQSKIKALVA